MKPKKIETLMDLKHAQRKHVLDNLPKSEPWETSLDFVKDGSG